MILSSHGRIRRPDPEVQKAMGETTGGADCNVHPIKYWTELCKIFEGGFPLFYTHRTVKIRSITEKLIF